MDMTRAQDRKLRRLYRRREKIDRAIAAIRADQRRDYLLNRATAMRAWQHGGVFSRTQ